MFVRVLSLMLVIGCATLQSAGFSSPALAAPTSYLLKLQTIRDRETRVSVYNAKTGNTVWTMNLMQTDRNLINWTPDHRAVTIVHVGDPDGGLSYRIVIWKAGNNVRIISKIPLPASYRQSLVTSMKDDLLGADSLMQVALSPDKKRLLVRASFSQGPGSLDVGELWCLTLSSFHVQQLDPEVQGDAHWLDARTIKFIRLRFVAKAVASGFPESNGVRVTKAKKVMRVE